MKEVIRIGMAMKRNIGVEIKRVMVVAELGLDHKLKERPTIKNRVERRWRRSPCHMTKR